jgi:Zn-dependent protease
MVIFSLGVHELGHVVAALAADVPVYEVGMKFIGAYTRRQRAGSRRQEIAISAAGPLASVLMFFVLFFVPKIGPWLSAWNLGIVVLNIAPYPGTDGYRILKTLFSQTPMQARPFMIEAQAQPNTI